MAAVESRPRRSVMLVRIDARPRREIESTVTASSSTPPVTTNFVPDDRPSRPRPLSMPIMTRAPSSAAFIVPRPPNSDVPPITAAAIGYSSTWPPPVPVSTERRREASRMPPSTAMPGADHEAGDLDPVDVDAGAPRGLGVAADRVDVAPVAGPVEDVGPEHEQDADDHGRVGHAAVLVRDQHDRAERDGEAADPQRDDQHRVGREAGLVPAPVLQQLHERVQPDADRPQQPRRARRHEVVGEADDELALEDHRALAADQQEHDAVPREQAGEGDDERRHADLRDDQAVQQADAEAAEERDARSRRRPGARCRRAAAAAR